jgi:hypothetical protein
MTNARTVAYTRDGCAPELQSTGARINAIVLGGSAVFVDTFGVHIESRVHEFVSNSRIGWFGVRRDALSRTLPCAFERSFWRDKWIADNKPLAGIQDVSRTSQRRTICWTNVSPWLPEPIRAWDVKSQKNSWPTASPCWSDRAIWNAVKLRPARLGPAPSRSSLM